MRETIGAVVRKPVFRIKLIAISLLFVVSLIEQSPITIFSHPGNKWEE